MKIKITRLILLIIACIFLGMCIVWWFLYIAKGQPTGILNLSIVGIIVVIISILGLQYWENRKDAGDKQRLEEFKKKRTEKNDKIE